MMMMMMMMMTMIMLSPIGKLSNAAVVCLSVSFISLAQNGAFSILWLWLL